jgi:hypothetical protein
MTEVGTDNTTNKANISALASGKQDQINDLDDIEVLITTTYMVCIYICTLVFMYVCMYVCMYVSMYVYIYIYYMGLLYMCVCVCMYAQCIHSRLCMYSEYVCMYVCVGGFCMYAIVYVCM